MPDEQRPSWRMRVLSWLQAQIDKLQQNQSALDQEIADIESRLEEKRSRGKRNRNA